MNDSEKISPAMTPQQAKFTEPEGSALKLYKEFAVGSNESLLHLAHYELVTFLFGGLSGLPGFGLRSLFYPALLKHCGKRPVFGRGVVLRNPRKISVGKKLLADDYAVLDVRGEGASLSLGDYVSVGRFTTLAAKGGHVRIGNAVNIGSYCRLATQSALEIGDSTLIAAYCYLGPGNHKQGDGSTPLISREMDIKGGVRIGAHAWIGARVTILDGVTIGDGAIIGAHSLVLEDIPPGAVAAGTPARIISRQE